MSAIFDIGVILILLISAGVSFFRGFIREVLTIVGIVGGGLAALMFGKSMLPITYGWFGVVEGKEDEAGKLFDLIPYELVAQVTAYGVIFLVVFIVLQLASHFFSAAVAAIGLGPVDRTLGVFFGLVRGMLFLGLLYLPFQATGALDQLKEEYLSKSKTLFYVEQTSVWIKSFLPSSAEEAGETTRNKLEQLEMLKSAPDAVPSESQDDPGAQDGYQDKDRQSLDGLIEKQAPEPAGKGFNE